MFNSTGCSCGEHSRADLHGVGGPWAPSERGMTQRLTEKESHTSSELRKQIGVY